MRKYGRLTQVEFVGYKETGEKPKRYVTDSGEVRYYKTRRAYALFKCDCGKVVELVVAYVMSGNNRSCGCLKRDAGIAQMKYLHESGKAYKYVKASEGEWKGKNNLAGKRHCYKIGNTPHHKGKFRLHEKPNDKNSRFIYINEKQLTDINCGIVPPEIRSKMSIHPDGSITLH